MQHDLKILPQHYCRVADGSKTFEVRDNDPGYQPGDTVILREWNPTPVTVTDKTAPKGYTDSPPLEFKVGYIEVLSSGRVAFSLLPVQKPATSAKKRR